MYCKYPIFRLQLLKLKNCKGRQDDDSIQTVQSEAKTLTVKLVWSIDKCQLCALLKLQLF